MQFDQDVVDIPDWDKYVRTAADTTGVPQNIIQETGDVNKKRKERKEAVAKAQQKQELLEGASAMKDASAADKNLAQAQQGG